MIAKLFKNCSKLLYNMSFRTRLLLTYFIIILLPLSIFTYITYIRVSKVMLNQTLSSTTQVFTEASSILDKEFGNADNVISIITHDSFIYDVASTNPSSYEIANQLEDSNRITDMFRYLEETTGVNNIKLYTNNNFIFSDENVNMFNIENIKNSNWYRILNSQTNNTIWCPPSYFEDQPENGKNIFSIARIIFNLDKLTEKLAVLRVDIKEDIIKNTLINAALTPNTSVYILGPNDIILSNNTFDESNFWSIRNKNLQKLPSRAWSTLNIKNQTIIINYTPIKNTGWYLVYIIPKKDIMAISIKFKNEMLVYMFIVISLSYILVYFISNSNVKRLSLLTKEMRKVERGNLNVSLERMGQDEIGELMYNFNNMVIRTSVLMEEKYKMGQEIKSAELKALQAQINPHFLYNSLDLINCIAIKHNIPDIIKMVSALAKFYKLSLSKGKDIVSIKDEITHVQLYVEIQNMRFDNKIDFVLDIDEEIYEYSTLKILLQPIVENSILHGIFEKDSKSGTIKITSQLNAEVITFTIEDDGIGIPKDKIYQLLSDDNSSNNKGYGSKNTNDRIKLFYGEQFGLSYSSELNKGTTVKLQIPAVPLKL